LDALSVEKIEKFIAQVNECGRFSLDQSPLLALEKIKYVVNGRPNWAAMLLFAEEPVRHHMHFHIEETGSGLLITFEIKAYVTPPVSPPSPELELKILGLLKGDPQLSSSELAAVLSIGRDTVKEYLGRLKRKGLLVREGTPRSGNWVVLRDGRNDD
jgi:predicted HTH transcriptional regulator